MEETRKKTELYARKTACCGCAACANGCPKQIICMEADDEGFLYPRLTDPAACIGCGLCDAVCPMKHADELHAAFTEAYAGWCADGSSVQSASGGAATALGRQMLAAGGIVYGAVYTEDCRAAEYARAETEAELCRMRTSKYIQAAKGETFRAVKADLAAGRRVLFIGLPCDVFAVKRFVGDHGGGLSTVSLICHGPTSPRVHAAFLSQIEARVGSTVTNINVRYKKNGQWKPYYIRAGFANGATYLHKFQATDYDTAFRHFKRPACTVCGFKGDKFAADLLIGDFHTAERGTAAYHASGVSTLLPLTATGFAMLDALGDDFVLHRVDLGRSIGQRAVHSAVNLPIDRAAFVRALDGGSLHAACRIPILRREVRKNKRRRAVFALKSAAYQTLRRLKIRK